MFVKIFSIVLCLACVAGCTRKISADQLNGIYPGMPCSYLSTHFKGKGLTFEKDDGGYELEIKGDVWKEVEIDCGDVVNSIEFCSKYGNAPKSSEMYAALERKLMDAFREDMITYEEGEGVISFNNGLILLRVVDSKTGVIKGFKAGVTNVAGAKNVWERAYPILSSFY